MKLKLAGHETFYPREHWLYKGMNEKAAKIHAKNTRRVNEFFKESEEANDEYPTDYMGVGINMVKSIRHWVNAFGLLEKDSPSDFISPILKRDRYLDKLATSWILHYQLIGSENPPTTWYWFFTHSDLVTFDKETFIRSYKEWIESLDIKQNYSEKSLENDYQVLTGMYAKEENKDLFYPSQFANLGILSYNPHYKRYTRNANPAIDPHIVLYCMLMFRDRFFSNSESLDLENIRNIPESPLRVFKIDIDYFYEIMERVTPKIAKKFKLSRTAGMKTMQLNSLTKQDLLSDIYSIERQDNYLD